ncbi:MAG: CvpA family protein [Bacteroidota bacterium]
MGRFYFAFMNFIDILICVPIIWGIYKGVTQGIVTQAAGIIAFSLGIWLASKYSEKLISIFAFAGKYSHIVSFSVMFLITVIIVFLLARLISKMIDSASLTSINKMAGAVFGGLKFALILSVIFFVIDAIESSYPMLSVEKKNSSLLYRPVAKIAPTIIPGLKHERINNYIPKKEDVKVDVSIKRSKKENKE